MLPFSFRFLLQRTSDLLAVSVGKHSRARLPFARFKTVRKASTLREQPDNGCKRSPLRKGKPVFEPLVKSLQDYFAPPPPLVPGKAATLSLRQAQGAGYVGFGQARTYALPYKQTPAHPPAAAWASPQSPAPAWRGGSPLPPRALAATRIMRPAAETPSPAPPQPTTRTLYLTSAQQDTRRNAPSPRPTTAVSSVTFGVGRDASGALGLVLTSDDVSTWHALFTYDEDEQLFYLRDLNSLNGTYVNGEKLGRDPVPVEEGARLHFGGEETSSFTASYRK